MNDIETFVLLNGLMSEHRASCSSKSRDKCPTEPQFVRAIDRIGALGRVAEAARAMRADYTLGFEHLYKALDALDKGSDQHSYQEEK